MMAWLLRLFGGAVLRYIISGAFVAALVAGAVAWHKWNFISRDAANAEISKWKNYSTELLEASREKERLGIQAEKERIEAEEKIDALEKENDRLLEEDRKGDDPVLLNRDDVRRLQKAR